MISTLSPVLQGVLGTLFTWGVTAAGAGIVFVTDSVGTEKTQQKFLDGSLGFAAGVMLAASYWSLLAPAIEMSEDYGSFAFLPASIGFILGALMVYAGDVFLRHIGATGGEIDKIKKASGFPGESQETSPISSPGNTRKSRGRDNKDEAGLRHRRPGSSRIGDGIEGGHVNEERDQRRKREQREKENKWRSMMLLVAAITIHNFPEGLAVGVGFGAIGKSPGATFAKARNLAIGIGLQNFPEGLAVSLPLRRIGFSPISAFWWGQMSGMVEPVGGFLGAVAVSFVEPILPYALSLAAGAMVYVVVDELVPDAQASGNPKLATWGCIVGFVVMMTLDVALG
mmetsp:Transcript_37770/g.73174  ORF Transcript_37770/g.73174 Transcript_37770/m.73174 type:complete len:340 (+) Transcript_37770:40-1059(+)